MSTGEKFERAVAIMARLRGPGGCPWDREQTFDSIKPYTLEETYEVLDAIDKRDWEELPAELGDLLLQVLFYSEMAKEDGKFSIDSVLDRLAEKLVSRHPHVFGDTKAETSQEVLRNWEALKQREKKPKRNASQLEESILNGVLSAMPALMEAQKISYKVAHVGFDWPEINALFEKLDEEIAELKAELRNHPGLEAARQRGIAESRGNQITKKLQDRLEDELGDLFFVVVNIARYLSVDSEMALRKMNARFRERFRFVEDGLLKQGKEIKTASLVEMEELWQAAKRNPNQE